MPRMGRHWRSRVPARLYFGASELPEITFNRTRENGLVDRTVGVLRADAANGAPLAIASSSPFVLWGLRIARDNLQSNPGKWSSGQNRRRIARRCREWGATGDREFQPVCTLGPPNCPR